MKNTIWLVRKSLELDYKFFKVSGWKISKKLDFIVLKYFIIVKHLLKKFELGSDRVYFSKEKIYYDSKFGLAGYQSVLSRHQKMMQIARIENVQCVIDIGANVGFFSKLCRELYPQSAIYSFEPVSRIFECLALNFKNDVGTKCFELGMSDFCGSAKMKFDEGNSAVSMIDEKGDKDVKVVRLDDFISENKISSVDILKIDTETFEAHVLRGGANTLSKVKYIFLEITVENNGNYTFSSIMKLLCSKEFDFQLVAFRNYADKGEGEMPIMDILLKNTRLVD